MRHAQLRAFHAVALHGGFSRAAEALGLTQPAISDQVRALERDYDLLLFDRSGRGAVPTEAGARLFAVTRRFFAVEAEARDLLTEARAARAGSLRLIADAAGHILRPLRAFAEARPEVAITLRAGNSEQAIAALRAYEADLAVVGYAPEDRGFLTLPLGRSPLIAFASAGALPAGAAGGAIALADLARAPLVLREPGSKTREGAASAFRAAGLDPVPRYEVEGREAVRALVATGAGVGVVSAAEYEAAPGLIPLRLADSDAAMEETLLCLAERAESRLIRAFFDLARKTAPG